MKNKLEDINTKIKENPRLVSVLKYANETGKIYFSSSEESDGGLCSTDVTGVYMPDNLLDFFTNIFLSLKESIKQKFGIIDAFSLLPKNIPWSGWVWCVDSHLSMKHEIAMTKYRDKKNKLKYDELVNSICPLELHTYMSESYHELNNGIWVGKHDPSLIICDETVKPFEFEKGWSQKQIGEILEIWYTQILDKKAKPIYDNNLEW